MRSGLSNQLRQTILIDQDNPRTLGLLQESSRPRLKGLALEVAGELSPVAPDGGHCLAPPVKPEDPAPATLASRNRLMDPPRQARIQIDDLDMRVNHERTTSQICALCGG